MPVHPALFNEQQSPRRHALPTHFGHTLTLEIKQGRGSSASGKHYQIGMPLGPVLRKDTDTACAIL